MKKIYFFLFFGVINLYLFCAPQREEYCYVDNNTNSELFLSLTYVDDFIHLEQGRQYELPIYENGDQIGFFDPLKLNSNTQRIKKVTYVLRTTSDWSGDIFRFYREIDPTNRLSHLTLFRNLVEDFLVYDSAGNVIMTIEDINENTLKGDYVSMISITPEMAENGRGKYNALPKFNGTVMNMPESSFVIENDSNSPIMIIQQYKNLPPGIHSTGLITVKNYLLYLFKYYEGVDPMTLFYMWTDEINIYDPNGNTIFTFKDITDRFIRTVAGSETYGHKTYTVKITDQDIIQGIERNKNIEKINIDKELENIRRISNEYYRERTGVLEKDVYHPLIY
jgi:hypothetical protein